MTQPLDLLVRNVRVVRPHRSAVDLLDVGIKDGRFARLAPDICPDEAAEVMDGKNRLAFPGLVDAHMHVGIYRPMADDAVSESKAAAKMAARMGREHPKEESGRLSHPRRRPARAKNPWRPNDLTAPTT